MVDNPGLLFFYVSQFMQDCVYYAETLNTWAVAELEAGELLLHNVFAPEGVTLDAAVAAFGAGVKKVTLGFALKVTVGYSREEYREEDCTFFVKGDTFREDNWQNLRIPSLSHA